MASDRPSRALDGQLGLEGPVLPPRSLRLPGAVWGIDPSTVRMAVGVIVPTVLAANQDGTQVLLGVPLVAVKTRSLPRGELHVRQAGALVQIEAHLRQLVAVHGEPVLVAIEKPFAHGRFVPPESYYVIGALLVALGRVLPLVELVWWNPGEWKVRALGKGGGAAKKPRIMEWARSFAGYEGALQDEADALGIATAGGVELEQRSRAV